MVLRKNDVIAMTQITLLLMNGFFFKHELLGVSAGVLSVFLLFTPAYMIPTLLVSAFMDMDCFIVGNLTASRFFTLLLIFAPILLNKDKSVFNLKLLVYVIISVFYISISAFYSSGNLNTSAMTMLLNLFLIVSMSAFNANHFHEVKKIIEFACCEILLCMFVNLSTGSNIHYNGAYEFISDTNNNMIGMVIACVGAFFVGCYMTERDGGMIKKIFYISVVCACLFLAFLSGSRSATFGLFAAICVGLVISLIQSGANLMKIIGFAAVFAIVCIILNDVLLSFPVLADRFTLHEIQKSGGTGRFEIWSYVWNEVFPKNPIFGVGFGGEQIKNLLLDGMIKHSGIHNLFLDVLCQLGILGFTFFMYGLFYLLKNLYKESKNDINFIIPFVMLIACVFNGIGENIFLQRHFWVVAGLGTMFFNKDFNQRGSLKK